MASVKVCDLRSKLGELGLSSKGNKSKLLERLGEAYISGHLPCASCKVLEDRVKALEDKLEALSSKTQAAPEKKKKKENKKKKASLKCDKKKILLLGDSNGRHCSSFLQEELGSNYKVCGMVKPGAPFEEVVRDCPKLAGDADVLVAMAGTNNISMGRRIDFRALQHQLPGLRPSTRVILMKIPPRFDNPRLARNTARVNENFPHIKGVSICNPFSILNRSHFTSHGLHMNVRGKRTFAKNLATYCRV